MHRQHVNRLTPANESETMVRSKARAASGSSVPWGSSSNGHYNPHHHSNHATSMIPPMNTATLFVVILTAVPSYFLGSLSSLYAGLDCSSQSSAMSADSLERRVQERLAQSGCSVSSGTAVDSSSSPTLFPEATMGNYMVGMARINKTDLTSFLDLGVPIDEPKPGILEATIIYNNKKAMPHALNGNMPLLGAQDALKNCDFLNVILMHDAAKSSQCTAIIPQYESYHIQKWMRIDSPDSDNGKDMVLNSAAPLSLVSRNHQATGLKGQFRPPAVNYTRTAWNMLETYFNSIDDVLADLKPILARIALDNTVIVLVCNFGHSELLVNFVCSAHRRGLDTSNIIVFATDQETADLVASLGLTAYYDYRNFGLIPTGAARRYGDARFVAMMMAKVLCVLGPSMLGYNILFQDVDIVWYKNPMEYFHNNNDPAIRNFDVFFQDDGQHSTRYAPWSANSGFYYVKANDRSLHFLLTILTATDMILRTDSHQQALIAVMSEHASLYGLRVKVLNRELDEFPGGYQFHQKSGKYMRDLFAGAKNPIIFHMSWTNDKTNKLRFFKQMGEWYVQPTCIGKNVTDIPGADTNVPGSMVSACCAAEPLISCHWADKPSVIPCKKSPFIDKGKRPSFWK
jgi:Nucleotide-diphospho-sugar transferase